MRVILFVIVFMIGIYRIPQPSLNSIEQPWVNRYVQFVKSQYMNYIWEPSIQPDLSEDQMLLRKDQFWQAEEKNRKLNNNNPNEDPIDWSIRRVVVYSRDQSCCRRCGARVPLDVHANDKYVAHIHHIIPRFKGGGDHAINNLILLCSDCHTFMKGKGHSELRGTTDYYISKNKIAHTEKCRYAKSIKQPIKTHAIRLLRDGCKLCKICDPLTFHEQVVRSWEPNINIYIQHAKYSLQQELVAFLENKVNKTNSMSASESIYRKW